MKLSILICTLEKRKHFLERLNKRLSSQLNTDVEVIINSDNGQKSIGTKRNELLDQAKGEYLAFIDDDDLVSEDYVARILEAVKTNPDCVGMEGHITINGSSPKLFIHSLQYREWYEKDNVYYRNPNHLSPVKTALAQQVRFPEINMGEDQNYSMRLLPLLNTEVYLKSPIYFYEYKSNK